MKALFFLIICIIIGAHSLIISEKAKIRMNRFKEMCMKVYDIDIETADRIIRNQTIKRNHVTDCFSTCFLDRIVKIREEGYIDVADARKSAAEEKVDVEDVIRVMEKCNGRIGKDMCETGGNLLSCLVADKRFPVLY